MKCPYDNDECGVRSPYGDTIICGACIEDRADARCIMTAATLQFESLRSLGKIDMDRQIEEMEDCIGDAAMALRAAQRAVREEK